MANSRPGFGQYGFSGVTAKSTMRELPNEPAAAMRCSWALFSNDV